MQAFLAAEIILQRGRIHAGIGGDLTGRGLVEPLLAEHTQCRSDDARPGLLAAGVAAILRVTALDPGLWASCPPPDHNVFHLTQKFQSDNI